MISTNKCHYFFRVLAASLLLGLADRLLAQTFTTLHDFSASRTNSSGAYTNSEGVLPSELLLCGDTLYGVASEGGPAGNGTIFKVNTDGSGFATIYTFTATFPSQTNQFGNPEFYTNIDGSIPVGPLILSGNTLYGVAGYGGSAGFGTVFAVGTNGAGFTTLYNFTAPDMSVVPWVNFDGIQPTALTLSGNTLYGTTYGGGDGGRGTVFALNTDGTEFRALYSFTPWDCSDPSCTYVVNSDGAQPNGLIVFGNTLFGTAGNAGSYGSGTVFALNTDGTGFTVLHAFTAARRIITPCCQTYANSDGAHPQARLSLSGNTLYGTTWIGGASGWGTVFAVKTDGTGFEVLHTFSALSSGGNSDGASPFCPLALSASTLYGTASAGGSANDGTVFAVNIDGTGFKTVHTFSKASGNYPFLNSDGANPRAALVLSGYTLYGTTPGGGRSGSGTIFGLSFKPQLSITSSEPNVILTWPTNYAGFDYTSYTLESATNLGLSAIWTTNSPASVIVNGQNTVTNPISGAQQFFRLIQ